MADTSALKNRIRAAIKANDNQEITGPVLQQALLDIVDELNGATETEASQRQNGDSTLQQNINTEKQRAEGAEQTLTQAIAAEKTRAEGAEQTLTQAIATEKTRAEGAEQTLTQAIAAEKTRAEGAEQTLTQAIAAEKTRAEGAEQTLTQAIRNLRNAGYAFGGTAETDTNPGIPSSNCFYIIRGAGTYTYFKNADDESIVISADGIYVLTYESVENQYWEWNLIVGIDASPTENSHNIPESGGVFAALNSLQTAIRNLRNAGYAFGGTAETDTNPGIPSSNCFYIVRGAGTYTYFKNADDESIVLSADGIYVLTYESVENQYWEWNLIIGINPRPKKGSANIVTSSGIFDNMGALDVSELNAAGGTLATYTDLSAALAAIPSDYQKGGMSIKFVSSIDNQYVQYRLMAQSFSTTKSDWQGVDTEIVAGSGNLAESGSVAKTLEYREVHAKEISPSMEEIYTSTTDNHLDVQNVVKGVYIKQQSGATASFTASDKGIVSRFIYVEGVSKVTVSCSVVNNKLSLMFLSKPILDNQYRVESFSFNGSSRTVSVPSSSKYLVVCLREPNTNPDYDYSGIKLSLTDSVAVQEYSGKYLGRAGYEYLFGETIATADEIPIATIENTRSDVDVMQGATVKDASLTYNTSFGPDTDAAKVLINIEAGHKYKVCVRDNDNVITKVYAIYKIINGSRSSTILTQFLPNTISQEFTAENGFDGLAFYIDRGDILKSGTVELVLYDISDSLEDKVKRLDEVTAEMEDKIFDKKAYKTSVSTGFEIPLAYAATAGNDIAYCVTSKDIDAYYFYVKYAGSDSFTNLGLSTDLNKIVHRSVSDNITDIKIFISAEHVLDRETYGTTTLEDCRALEGQVIDNTESIEHLESELGVFKQVANNALVRFIPFTSTVPTVEGTYQTPENFIETFNLLFFTDSHIDYANQAANIKNVKDTIAFANSSKRLMAFGSSNINKQLFDAVIHTGDIITSPSGRSKESALAFAKSFFNITEGSEVPVLFAPGNHDRNDRGNPPSAAFTFADWATLYGDFAETNYGIIRGMKDGNPCPWFYKDFDDKKIRVISVFVNDIDMSAVDGNGYVLYNESNGFYISQDQMDFIVDEALDFTQKPTQDWNVIITLHQSVWLNGGNKWYGCNVTPAFESALAKLFEVCKAFNAQGIYTNTYTFATNHFFDLDINADFTRYATAKWDSYTWQQSVGADKGVRYVCGRNKDEDFAVNFVDSGNIVNYYYLYVRYVGDASETLIGKYAPNEVRNITLTNNIEAVYILVKNEDITGIVNATVEILQRKPRIICWLNGHEHIDAHKIITGTNVQGVAQEGAIADGGINIIWTAQGAAMMFASNMKVPRIIDSPTQNLLDLVSIDTIRRKIRIIRVGAGPNCFGVGIPYGDRFMPDGLDY